MFSTGFVFFYWDNYKNGGKRTEFEGFKNSFKGFSESELSVSPKHDSFKDETLNHLNITGYKLAITKAKEYTKTIHAAITFTG